ncbi:hypothetical protein LCGC14_1662660 [marine sediment metagenome]|uniref:Uncharacterized protein n=1 Tax=marine sediment metagenome TaxID=412755 RepID=A0A0F9K9F7_9ZZZZ
MCKQEHEKWKKIAEKGDCVDNKCTVSEEHYKKLEDEMYHVLCPCVGPDDWSYATSRRSIERLSKLVRRFVAERLLEIIGEKK